MREGTQLRKVLDELANGPATSSEMAAATGLSLKHCCAHLRELWKLEAATRKLMARQPGQVGRLAWLYELNTRAPPCPKT